MDIFIKIIRENKLCPYHTDMTVKVTCNNFVILTLLHSEQPKLHGVLAVLSAIGLSIEVVTQWLNEVVVIRYNIYVTLMLMQNDFDVFSDVRLHQIRKI